MSRRTELVAANLKAQHFIQSAIWALGTVPANKALDASREIIAYLKGSEFCGEPVRELVKSLEFESTEIFNLDDNEKYQGWICRFCGGGGKERVHEEGCVFLTNGLLKCILDGA